MTQETVEVTDEDRAAWEKFGPAIFHCDMTGPEALARYRIAAENRQRERDAQAEGQAKFWRDATKMNLPLAPSPIINSDRAKQCDAIALAIRTQEQDHG